MKETPYIFKNLKTLISQGNLDYVFESINNYLEADNELFNEFIVLSKNFHDLNKKSRLGILSNQDKELEENQLVFKLLKFIDQLKEAETQSTKYTKQVGALLDYKRIKEEKHKYQEYEGVVIGNYRIGKFINSGGFGSVFSATDVMKEIEVAIKISKPLNVSQDYIQNAIRFARRVLKLPKEENLLNIFYIGTGEVLGEKRIYYVMELMDGRSLYDLIRDIDHPISVEAKIEIFKKLCKGLQTAHELKFNNEYGAQETGLIHGDIKPSNILLTEKNDPKISDFLLVDFYLIMEEDKDITKRDLVNFHPPTSVIGTKAYMAPEQLSQGIINQQTDIYSLGVLFFELLTSKVLPLFSNKKWIVNELDAKGLETFYTLKKIICKCTEYKPNERYANIQDILHDLESIDSSTNSSWFSNLFNRE